MPDADGGMTDAEVWALYAESRAIIEKRVEERDAISFGTELDARLDTLRIQALSNR